ncbi:Na+/H+ antiporter subunit A [Rarobacter faecitabidus]
MALAAPILLRHLGRVGFSVLAIAPAAVAGYALTLTSRVMDGGQVTERVTWMPALGVDLSFRIDTLGWVMLLIVGAIGAIVLVYCSGYFSATATGSGRFGAVFVAFAGAMAGLAAADNTIVLFVFWELTTVFSYLLIGHYSDRKASRRAAMQAIVITTAGGLALLVGLIILGETVPGGYELSTLLVSAPSGGTAVTAALVCVITGAASKSALIPTHFWLPGAMAAPTPVSSYLHAAAMVKAGVYLIARFAPAFASNAVWISLILILGLGTYLLGGYRALRQHDLKLVLAYGTVSQLGMLITLLGIGSQAAALGGLALLCAHAMFKAALFLTTGAVDVIAGTRDLRRLSGVGRRVPSLAVAGGLATASMIALAPTAGYVAKEAALDGVLHAGIPAAPDWIATAVFIILAIGSMLTVAYGLRFWWGAFATKTSDPSPATEQFACIEPATIKKPSYLLSAPPLVLAVAGLVAGLFPATGERLLEPYADLFHGEHAGHLALWSGVTPAFVGTVAAIALGLLLFRFQDVIEGAQQKFGGKVEADYLYRRMMRKLDDFAADVTGFTQRGSLPFYLGVIFSVFALAAGSAFIASNVPLRLRLWDSPAQLLPVAVICITTVLVVRSRRRFKAVLLAGFAGYSVAALFVLHGAPDLALTQVLVETVTLVVLVLVLRRLPPYFSDRPLARSRWTRLTIAIAAGVGAMGLAVIAPNARIHAAISDKIGDFVYEYGGGRNIVNVILVDTRGWDTMGEISVLLVAATGVASLVFLRRRTSAIERVGDLDSEKTDTSVWGNSPDPAAPMRRQAIADPAVRTDNKPTWIKASRTLAPQRRSLIFEVITRIVFHPVIVFGAFLLFAGHNKPGGGFAAGLVVGIALIIRYLAGGRYELAEALPVQPGSLLGSGLVLAVGTGLAALITKGTMLESVIWKFHLPIFGDVKIVSSLFFDIGVFLVVVGLVLDILRSLGAEIDKQGEVTR